MRQYGLALLAGLLLALHGAQAGLVLVDVDGTERDISELNTLVEKASDEGCKDKVAAVCGQVHPNPELLFGGVVNKFSCLTNNQNALGEQCFVSEIESTLEGMVEGSDNKCKDELRSKCGKQIDALKKAIESTSVIGTIKGTVDVVECIINNAEDLWNHCKPKFKLDEAELGEGNSAVELSSQEDCTSAALALCPQADHKVLGLGFTLGCLVEKTPVLGATCVHERIVTAMDDLEQTGDKPCKDELRKRCGKQIDQLKKQIQQTSILGTIKAAVDVAQCVAQNAEALWNKCKPFHEEALEAQRIVDEMQTGDVDAYAFVAGAPTPPTRKPTHKPTRRPTNKPTPRPTNKPTKASPTAKPTPRKIADEVASLAAINWMNPGEIEVDWSPIDVEDRHSRPDDRDDNHHRRHHDDDRRRPYPPDDHHRRHHDDDDRRRPYPPDNHHRRHHDDDRRRPCPDHHHRHHRHGHHGGRPGDDGFMSMTTVELDMDACVQSARKFCAAEVAEFNASPFDNSLFEKMNACIERNAAMIEADCIVSVQQEAGWFTFLESENHPPCRHPDDAFSNLPVCSKHHRCLRGRKLHIIAGIFGLVFSVLAMIFVTRRLYAKHSKAYQVADENGQTVDGKPQYQPLVESKV